MSNMYSLLNLVAATSKEMHDGPHHALLGNLFPGLTSDHAIMHSDHVTLHSMETATHGHTEEERRLITTSTISVVSRLALEFKRDDVSAVITVKETQLRISYTGHKTNNCYAYSASPHF
jgi:phosphatidylinositol 4-kinase A